MASALSALPAVEPAYGLFGEVANDPVHCETRRLVSVLETFPDHPHAAEAREALARRGVIVPARRGQLPLTLAANSASHYDALILGQQSDLFVFTPGGFGFNRRNPTQPKLQHRLRAGDAREQLAVFDGMTDVYLCPNEFRGRRQRGYLTALNALFVDVDFHDYGATPTLDLMKEVADQRIEHLHRVGFELPSLRVFSGRGFHLYWSHERLDESEVAHWSQVQGWLQSTLDSDPHATDTTRFLRLVGSVNGKTGSVATAERVGPTYTFDALYRRFLAATGQPDAEQTEAALEREIAALEEIEEPGYAASGLMRATVIDANVFKARTGRPATMQAGITLWFDRVYRDIRAIIEHHGWQGRVPQGHRNTLLFHLGTALAWFTDTDALRDEIVRANRELIGLPTAEALNNTATIIRRAQATRRLQPQLRNNVNPDDIVRRAQQEHGFISKFARRGEFRYGASRRQLWKDLRRLIPDDLVPRLQAILPDDVWGARRQERERARERARDRVREGRYQRYLHDLRAAQYERRRSALALRERNFSWEQVGNVLGISADSARKLASRLG